MFPTVGIKTTTNIIHESPQMRGVSCRCQTGSMPASDVANKLLLCSQNPHTKQKVIAQQFLNVRINLFSEGEVNSTTLQCG